MKPIWIRSFHANIVCWFLVVLALLATLIGVMKASNGEIDQNTIFFFLSAGLFLILPYVKEIKLFGQKINIASEIRGQKKKKRCNAR
jgi:hypothetical protein